MKQIEKSNKHNVKSHKDFKKFITENFSEYSGELKLLDEYPRKNIDIDVGSLFSTWFLNA